MSYLSKLLSPLLLMLLMTVVVIAVLYQWGFLHPHITPDHATTGWIKLDNRGERIDIDKASWKCVTDPSTGLTWENKEATENTFSVRWSYTWQNNASLLGFAEGSCSGLSTCNTINFINYANRGKMCGFDDWRLPTLTEMKSIIDYDVPIPGPRICNCLFKHTQRSSYWTSTAATTNQQPTYYGLNFKTLEARVFPVHATLYVRLVRGKAYSDVR